MYIAILGRQPALGMAELEALYGSASTHWFSPQTARISTDEFSVEHLGGTIKAGRIIAEIPNADWRKAGEALVHHYAHAWRNADYKITLGISAYGFTASSRDVQKPGILLKQKLKTAGVSLRLIPNTEPALNSATSHHNKLGLSKNKCEILIVRNKNGRVIIAESIGAQNITALARRDQGRPKRDAFVGMLPPKLAQIMINLAAPTAANHQSVRLRLLDPFCGTGVLLQEAALQGYDVYGTDLSDKMIDYSRTNLEWLAQTHHTQSNVTLQQGDAMTAHWQAPIDLVACETYLGQPFSAPPAPAKLDEVRRNCDHIMSSFLKNLHPQIPSGTPLCLAVPAWRDTSGRFTHLRLIENLETLGYIRHAFTNIQPDELLYYREDQIVARQLLVLAKA